ncbi:MAG: AmmeMemoRadiSam system radical SAM enzyme [Deltaproteobacteria bacterium]|nr:AmmeMemoRadiSam system radical SAM enzyme [Deltaproteobacteria bacterium]
MKRTITRRDFLAQGSRYSLYCVGMSFSTAWLPVPASCGTSPAKGFLDRKLSPYFEPLEEGRIRCTLCPRECEVAEGERGYCRVRENGGGKYYSLAYGNPCAVHVDPIEKKPFFHVLPGTLSFSVATAGCNFHCKFCQNWEISQAKPEETFNFDLPPPRVVEEAVRLRCQSIASTYVEPTIFMEYMRDLGQLARERGLLKVMHSNGYVNEAPLRDLCGVLHAACIDLKGFSDSFYRELTEGTLQPVLSTLKRLHQWGVHTEIVNLVIPGKNDDMGEIRAMSRWIKQELGPEIPLHFTRFYPLYKLKGLPPTPLSTLEEARQVACHEGLQFVYIGNVPGHPAEHTDCPKCKERLVERAGYRVEIRALKDGKCGRCGRPIPGIWSIG